MSTAWAVIYPTKFIILCTHSRLPGLQILAPLCPLSPSFKGSIEKMSKPNMLQLSAFTVLLRQTIEKVNNCKCNNIIPIQKCSFHRCKSNF